MDQSPLWLVDNYNCCSHMKGYQTDVSSTYPSIILIQANIGIINFETVEMRAGVSKIIRIIIMPFICNIVSMMILRWMCTVYIHHVIMKTIDTIVKKMHMFSIDVCLFCRSRYKFIIHNNYCFGDKNFFFRP